MDKTEHDVTSENDDFALDDESAYENTIDDNREDFIYSADAGINENACERDISVNPGVPVLSSKSKKNSKKIILLLCLICALAGGITGGVVSGLVVKSSISVSQNTDSDTVITSSYSENDNSESTTSSDADQTQTTLASADNTNQSQTSDNTSNTSSLSKTTELTASEIYSQNVGSVVSIEAVYGGTTSYGTGFIVSDEGYIVTNYHVISDTTNVTISLYDDTEYAATIVGYEENNDIAVLKIETAVQLSSVVYGISSNLSVGDSIYIIGNPLGDLTFTLTTGVVSALNRLVEGEDGMSINMFQTDAAVNSGNSGGPVFNRYGQVVGIASAKYASSSIEGLGFCIPIDDVSSMINEIINKGYVSGKPLMGISVYDTVTSSYGFIQSARSINGAKVAAVGTNSAAVNSGIQVDDIITAVDGETVSSVSSLKTILTSYRCGDTVTLTVYRDNSTISLTMTFDEYEPVSSTRTSYSNVYDL